MISKNLPQREEKPRYSQRSSNSIEILGAYLTCSSNDNDAARLRDFAFGSDLIKGAFFRAGLPGGDISEAGVVLVSALDLSSDMSSPCAVISHIGSFRWLFGESAIVEMIDM